MGFQHAAEVNKIITDYKNKVLARKLQYEIEERIYTPDMLLENCRMEYNPLICVYRHIMEEFLAEKPIGKSTMAHYQYVYKLLAKFFRNDSFLINELTENKIRAFIKIMLTKISEGTLHTVCAKIAAVSNYALSRGIIKEDEYCFKRFGYTNVVKKANKNAYIDKNNLLRLENYYLNLVTVGNEDKWDFKNGQLEKLRKRTSKEFALCFWMAMLKLNGSAPIDVALLKIDNLSTRFIVDGKGNRAKYYCFDFKRAKTGKPVHPRIVCDRLARAIFEPFIETAHLRNGYLFPIIQNDRKTLTAERNYESIKYAVQYVAKVSLAWMKKVCGEINEKVTRENELTQQNMPLIEIERLSCYNIRHSFAMAYLSSPGSNVNSLASLLARSPNTIGTYITQLNSDIDLIASVAAIGI